MSEILGSIHPAYKQQQITARKDAHAWRATNGPSIKHRDDNDNRVWQEQHRQRSEIPNTTHLASTSRYAAIDNNNNKESNNCNNISPRFHSPPSASLESTRPHVFWHASPSPTQQIRHRDLQKYLSSNASPIQPLGTQAFRDELLRQGSAKKDVDHVQLCTKVKKPVVMDLCDHNDLLKRRDSIGSFSLSSTNTTSTSRKFSRRLSRRSMITSGESSLISNTTSGDGVHRLLADLNEHLRSNTTDLVEVESRISDESSMQTDLSGALDQNESLAKELDRIFSSQDEQLPENSNREQRCKGKGPNSIEVKNISIDASPSNSRIWSRIKSSPAEMEASPRSVRKSYQMTKVNSTKDCFEPRDKRQRISTDMSEINAKGLNIQQRTSTTSKAPTRTSPRKRAALAEIKAVQLPTIALGKFVQDDDIRPREAKTRSSASPPKKWASSRIPRIGLSRHSTGSAQSHAINLTNINPAAPFKRPSKASNNQAKMTNKQPQSPPKEKNCVILLDSDDDQEMKKKDFTSQSNRRMQDEQVEKKKPEMFDEDISFDTSMDEDLLCIALEKVEAIQELLRISQIPKTETIKEDIIMHRYTAEDTGDDSFEFNSSDNEAMVNAMEAGGW